MEAQTIPAQAVIPPANIDGIVNGIRHGINCKQQTSAPAAIDIIIFSEAIATHIASKETHHMMHTSLMITTIAKGTIEQTAIKNAFVHLFDPA
ncbi:hypothetical protein N5D45_06915 [Stenotrophomonas sp. GD03819]|uniref:hypothetical protein n=1 Tax=Stenotrophomonas sp. GD03819 TaxID=2975384 RepID=UPI002449616D|nr:hypothetical protein [Stenotrophomonas sp. GD03819]MDH1791551.1 hypothetical protein [Stenotrophomonas sp. GD03819]